MKNKLSEAANRLEGQPMFQLLEKVKEREASGKKFIHFEIGDPNFSTPISIKEACIDAIRDDKTRYTSSSGLSELKNAISKFHTGIKPDPKQIVIAPGCNPLIYGVLKCLVNEGEEVMIPDPGFPTYESVLKFLGITPIRLPLMESNGFRMDVNDIEKKITPKTKVIIINSPNNPCGSVLTENDVDRIYAIAKKHGIFILSDEIYKMMCYDGLICSSPSYHDGCTERTIIINGPSKSFAMSGWRLGYMIGPEWLVEKVGLLLQTIVSCTNTFVQYACVELYSRMPLSYYDMMIRLQKRRDVLVEGLNLIPGISCLKPEGSFYVFPNITKTGLTSQMFADRMLDHGVALLPGTDFGVYGEGYVRLAHTTSTDNIKEGLARMECALKPGGGWELGELVL